MLVKRLLPLMLTAAAALFFILRDRGGQEAAEPEDTLIEMMLSARDGRVDDYLGCFGSSLAERIQTLTESRGRDHVAQWLKERGSQVKGFAILQKEAQGEGALLVQTETVYADKNTRQSFVLEQSGEKWLIIRSDSEMVSNWENEFGRPVWE